MTGSFLQKGPWGPREKSAWTLEAVVQTLGVFPTFCCENFFIFNILLRNVFQCCQSLQNVINSSNSNCIIRKTLLKIKNYQKLFAIWHLPRLTDIIFSDIN